MRGVWRPTGAFGERDGPCAQMVTFVIRDFVTFAVAWMLAEELAPGHLVTFVEQFIY